MTAATKITDEIVEAAGVSFRVLEQFARAFPSGMVPDVDSLLRLEQETDLDAYEFAELFLSSADHRRLIESADRVVSRSPEEIHRIRAELLECVADAFGCGPASGVCSAAGGVGVSTPTRAAAPVFSIESLETERSVRG